MNIMNNSVSYHIIIVVEICHCNIYYIIIFLFFQLKELYTLLNENYVEDDDNMFRFDYSPEFLKWYAFICHDMFFQLLFNLILLLFTFLVAKQCHDTVTFEYFTILWTKLFIIVVYSC